MYRLVSSQSDLAEAALDIASEREGAGLDTETYGTELTDRMFALQIATGNHVWYFNFHHYGIGTPKVWNRGDVLEVLREPIYDPDALWFIHNSKFDQRRLSMEGFKLQGGVHCTQTCEKFIYNQHIKYSLDACLSRRGRAKDDAVANYIAEHKLWTGTGKKKRKHFDRVPFDIMFRYACIDAEETRWLGLEQRKELIEHAYYHNDLQLQKVCADMEEVGITVRQDYAQGGLQYEHEQTNLASDKLSHLAGEPFRAGPNWLQRIFDKYSVPYRTNPKTGNPIFNKDALDVIDHPIAGLIREYRRHEKFASTYYSYYATRPTIHAEIKLAGTDTLRFSYAEPNLQNVPKEEDLDEDIPFQVRGCFEPRSKDHAFVMIDYKQQEFRLMLDYAGEHELIRMINDEGADVHTATAELVGCSRKHAKMINFLLLYGGGDALLAMKLGVCLKEAKELKAQYFDKLPKVKKLIRAIIDKAGRQGFINTWAGRKLHVPKPWYDKDTGSVVQFEYVMPNHLIQGGCADIIRLAMPPVHELIKREASDSALLVQVHDELLFEFHKNDFGLIEPVKKIMESIYRPMDGMRMGCDVDYSWKSWGKRDIIKGIPTLEYA